MSQRNLAQAIQGLFRQMRRLYRSLTKSLINWILRTVLSKQRRGKLATAGFVLPTTVLLILVVALTVGALTFRAYNRNTQVIGEAQQRVIYNAATPAIDRARSKMEFLFDPSRDTRYPGGVPSEELLYNMLLNDGSGGIIKLPLKDSAGNSIEAYDISDETRVDLNGDGKKDNAWSFRTDTDSDGKADATVIYSIALRTPVDKDYVPNAQGTNKPKSPSELLLSLTDSQKANYLYNQNGLSFFQVIRHGPLSNDIKAIGCSNITGNNVPEGGWFEDKNNSSILRKNFQIDALVIPDNSKSTAVTLELHQDRQINRGNKWGAWFRNDLEIYPGDPFNWNGAMHTEGSLIIGGTNFTAHLISGKKSCVYEPASNSEITVTKYVDANRQLLYQGVAISGDMVNNSTAGSASVYIQGVNSSGASPYSVTFNSSNDAAVSSAKPIDISIDPQEIHTEDGYTNRAQANNSTLQDWANLKSKGLGDRIKNVAEKAPYVDDLYRADDRWGPKYKYDNNKDGQIPAGKKVGDDIIGNQYSRLTLQNPPSVNSANAVGLDGYWERRARSEGLRILVGERLELGNLNTWFAPQDKNANRYIDSGETEGDPLYPPTVAPYPVSSGTTVKHIDQQRRSIRDNVSAVQATAIYHFNVNQNSDYPVACLATTVHPGTPTTLRKSINFLPTQFATGGDPAGITNEFLLSNFFTGQGTNGWEFNPPANDAAAFESAMNDANSSLRKALTNLANFAGDPDGAFPPKSNDPTYVHPYPASTMWGNFSNLRRALGKINGNYAGLSIADKTYLQTAACTLGILAYNINEVQQFDPSNPKNDFAPTKAFSPPFNSNGTVLADLADRLDKFINGDVTDGEVLPKSQLSTYGYKSNGKLGDGPYNARDYYNVPPEVFIGALKQQIAGTANSDVDNDPRIRLAELIMLHHQIRRDRTFGFRPSPAFGEYVIQTGPAENRVFPTACDPDEFTFSPKVSGTDYIKLPSLPADPLLAGRIFPSVTLPSGARDDSKLARLEQKYFSRYRLALSRLCGTVDTRNYLPGDPSKQAVVLPKFPSLYYIFPEEAHTLAGATRDLPSSSLKYDHRQPVRQANGTTGLPGNPDPEPYVSDPYIQTILPNAVSFNLIDNALPGTAGTNRAQFQTPVSTLPISKISVDDNGINASLPATTPSSRPYSSPNPSDSTQIPTVPFPIADYSVKAIALAPRELSDWKLPKVLQADLPAGSYTSNISVGPTTSQGANLPTNFILAPSPITQANSTAITAVPFLDRAFFDGRQYMLTRTLDIDLGMLRNNAAGSKNVWLPESGIVYAFREDAVREDAIKRPDSSNGMNVTDLSAPKDPPVDARGISTKAIDFLPDPDRRSHGFRLRNGAQVKRTEGLIDKDKNIRGLSFFSDQSLYIQGDFNLHQDGTDTTTGTRIEEFTQKLPTDSVYTPQQFYDDRKDRDDSFAQPNIDRWRPSELLADSISILSSDFCDGSVADSFVLNTPISYSPFQPDYKEGTTTLNFQADRTLYNKFGLYGPGCSQSGNTSFHNQNRPKSGINGNNEEWVREASSPVTYSQDGADSQSGYWPDFTSPIKISRAGLPLVIGAQASATKPSAPVTPPPSSQPKPYSGTYFTLEDDADSSRLMTPSDVRINTIVVSGIHPSRKQQGYGGLHNFPRLLEDWRNKKNPYKKVFFAGSFLQLNFSNYATAPYETESWEPTIPVATQGDAKNSAPYYQPPQRFWGYDVALQLSPAGPAASRFVTSDKNRSEFYSEPPANDPYINKLCTAVKNSTGLVPPGVTVNCPG